MVQACTRALTTTQSGSGTHGTGTWGQKASVLGSSQDTTMSSPRSRSPRTARPCGTCALPACYRSCDVVLCLPLRRPPDRTHPHVHRVARLPALACLFNFCFAGSWHRSGSWDNEIWGWDVESGEHTETLEGHHSSILCLAMSANGKLLCSGSADNRIIVWNPEDSTLVHALEGHAGSLRALALSADGARLYSGSNDKTIRCGISLDFDIVWRTGGLANSARALSPSLSGPGPDSDPCLDPISCRCPSSVC